MRSILALLFAIFVCQGPMGCGGGPGGSSPSPAPTPAASPAPSAEPVVAVASSETEEEEETERFAYPAEGLRDPFRPFIKLVTKEKVRPKVFVPKTPLQRFATEELSLVGIIWAGEGRSKALIEDPEGKGYVVGRGTLVGDRGGAIVRIEPEQAVIEERVVDLFGEEDVKMVTMTLRKPEDEVNP